MNDLSAAFKTVNRSPSLNCSHSATVMPLSPHWSFLPNCLIATSQSVFFVDFFLSSSLKHHCSIGHHSLLFYPTPSLPLSKVTSPKFIPSVIIHRLALTDFSPSSFVSVNQPLFEVSSDLGLFILEP